MIRLTGALFIIASSSLIGASVSRFYIQRVVTLEAFLRLMTHIESEIGGFLSPLDSIYASFRCPALEESGFIGCLMKKGGTAAINEYSRRLSLFDDEKELLLSFFGELGRHGAEGEARHCAYYKSKLAGLCETAKGEAASKKRLCLSLGVLFGIMLSVILI